MLIEYDPVKRAATLTERGLDFARANEVFAGRHLTREDQRSNYDEPRYQTAGRLDGRIVIVVWTPRHTARRIISMRKANEREIKQIRPALD
jgi:uncharacterized protein